MKAFLAVAEELNFGRAAQRLLIAQPAVSQQIINLEKRLGVRLFDRNKRGVRLTEAGNAFLEPCRAALQALDLATLQARNSGSGQNGTIRVGFNAGFGADHLVTLSRAVRSRYPNLVLKIGSSRRNSEILQLIEQDQLDVGFVGGPVMGKSFAQLRISMARLGVILPAEHSMSQLPTVSVGDLKAENFVLIAPAPGRTLRSMVDEACDLAGFRPALVTEVTDGMAMLTLVKAGLGLGFTTSTSTGLTPAGLTLVPLIEQVETAVNLVWKADNSSKALHILLLLARSLFPQQQHAARPQRG